MSDHVSDHISVEEVSACCGAYTIGMDDGIGHCGACGEWTVAADRSRYDLRVDQLESEGLTRSDAQGVADVEAMKGEL